MTLRPFQGLRPLSLHNGAPLGHYLYNSIYLFGILCHFQHSTCHITTGSFVGRGNQYIHLIKALYCKLVNFGNKLPTFPHKVRGLNRRPQRWDSSVLPLHQRDVNKRHTKTKLGIFSESLLHLQTDRSERCGFMFLKLN